MGAADVQDLAVRYGAAWAAHEVEAIMALHTEDTVFHLHGGGEPAVGSTATREAFTRTMEEWPDIRFERKRVHVGSAHFVSEYELSVTKGGREIVCDGVDVFSVRDGLVARKDTYLDWAAVQASSAGRRPRTRSSGRADQGSDALSLAHGTVGRAVLSNGGVTPSAKAQCLKILPSSNW